VRPLQAALLGYVCGVFWYMGNCYWIFHTMHVYEGLPVSASIGILILFSMYLGLYQALFAWLVGVLRQRYSPTIVLCAAPFVWCAVELARVRVTGFPWDLLGYTQVDNLTLDRLAPWTGVIGMSFVIAAVNALWLIRLRLPSRKAGYGVVAAATLVAVAATWCTVRTQPAVHEPAPEVATLLQENLDVGSSAGSTGETKQQMIESFTQLSEHPGYPAGISSNPPRTELIVWPEAPAPFIENDPVLRQALSNLAAKNQAAVIANAVTLGPINADRHYSVYNSAMYFRANGDYVGHYDKIHLVPFGEYTPYKPLFFFVGHLLDDLNFIPGTNHRLLDVDGHRVGTFICYESIFGDDDRSYALDGAQALVNISDDGWYGDTSAPWEHLDMVRMRAIENSRWILRATNTGVTAVVDPYGRITASLPRHIRSSMDVHFAYRDAMTFYTLHGDWFGWMCAIVSCGMALAALNGRSVPGSKAIH
jgi:apolipoprotein N-acyltransferase